MVTDQDVSQYDAIQGGPGDAWCGMHAINNFLGGQYRTRDDCRRARAQVVAALSEVAGGDVEAGTEHLDMETGWLSIVVINVWEQRSWAST